MGRADCFQRARRDLSRFFGCWLGVANLISMTTPWLEALAPTWGPARLWTTLIPLCCLVLLNPRRAPAAVLAAGVLAVRAVAQLARPCRFRAARSGPKQGHGWASRSALTAR